MSCMFTDDAKLGADEVSWFEEGSSWQPTAPHREWRGSTEVCSVASMDEPTASLLREESSVQIIA